MTESTENNRKTRIKMIKSSSKKLTIGFNFIGIFYIFVASVILKVSVFVYFLCGLGIETG